MNEYKTQIIRKHIKFHGFVQGVGFRYRAEHAANLLGATGWVRNNPDGTVSMEIQGTEEMLDKVIQMIEQGNYVRIDRIESKSTKVIDDERTFRVTR